MKYKIRVIPNERDPVMVSIPINPSVVYYDEEEREKLKPLIGDLVIAELDRWAFEEIE